MNSKFQVLVADCPWDFSDTLSMNSVKRGAKANYNTMPLARIKEMPIKDITDPNGAILALWVPSSLLQEGLDVMKAWGFMHKQTYVWVKIKIDPLFEIRKSFFALWKGGEQKIKDQTEKSWKYYLNNASKQLDILDFKKGKDFIKNTLSFGMGRLFRQTHEICLIGINNNKIYKQLENKSQRSVSFGENLKHSAKPEHLQDSLEIMFPIANKIELFARRIRPGWTCLGNEVCNGEDIYDSLAKLI